MLTSNRFRRLIVFFAVASLLGFSSCGSTNTRPPVDDTVTVHAGQAAELHGMQITMAGKGGGNYVGAVLKIVSPAATQVKVTLKIDTSGWDNYHNDRQYYSKTVDWGQTSVKQGENVYDIPVESYVGTDGGNLHTIIISIPADEVLVPASASTPTPSPAASKATIPQSKS